MLHAQAGAARLSIGAAVCVHSGSTKLELAGKAALLLAMAALEGPVERRRLALLLWPQSPEQQARNNLRTLVHRVNQRFGAELLVGAQRVGIDPAQATMLLPSTDALLIALDAGGPRACELLAQAGVEADLSEGLREWLDAARQRLRRQQLAGLSEALGVAMSSVMDQARATALARACVQLEPLSEHWHRQLMDTLARCGDRAAALAAYEDCKALLREQLGVLPDLLTRTVQLRLLQDEARNEPAVAVAATAAAPVAVATVALTPLGGAARYPLVEREAVLAEVLGALAQGQHVTLSGEAGVGKTRLLRQLAEHGNIAHSQIEQVSIRPGSRDEPYSALAQLLQELQPRRAPRIGVPEQVELARLAPLAFPEVQPSQAGLSAPRLHTALRHWAERLHEAGVQRLVLDDVHYADAASQGAFAALLVHPDGQAQAPLTLLLAHRTEEIDAVLTDALVASQVRHQARRVVLPRLTLQGVQTLLQAMHAEQTEAQAARLLQRTGGNPLFLIELAEHGREQAEQASLGLDALLRSRLALCSVAAQQLAAVAAVAAADFSVELAAAVTGQPPLALMPAWSELQQRGLFANNGLAHDLIRDAVLGALPAAIDRALHRQVAGHLEGLGENGVQVFRHLVLAQEYERALPHAVQHLHATTVAGLDTRQIEGELFDLLGRVSDAVLLDNLWLTANLKEILFDPNWAFLTSLVRRVERMPPTVAAVAGDWLSYERARLLAYRDAQMADAYAQLNDAAQRMREQGIERAWVECELAFLAMHLNGSWVHEHVMRAQAAVAGLPAKVEYNRLLMLIEYAASFCLSIVESLRSKRAAVHAARKRHDLGAIGVARDLMAGWCLNKGLVGSAQRLFCIDARAALSHAELKGLQVGEFHLAVAALSTGRFDAALHFIDSEFLHEAIEDIETKVLRTLIWLRLGQWPLAKAQTEAINLSMLDSSPHHFLGYAIAIRDIDLQAGLDPLPALGELVVRSREVGVSGVNQQLLEWLVAMRTLDPEARMAVGTLLIEHFRGERADARRRPLALLEVAETHAQAGSAGFRALALEAARELRRGRTSSMLYLPEGLVRCARLLEASDPAEAAALMHVARRWVRGALPHVPEFARASFVALPVNGLLLAADQVQAAPG